MRGLTDDRPKCLVSVKGKPLLDWQLDALREAGIRDIAIVTGYRRELLDGRGLTEFINTRWAQTNMVTSLSCAQEWLCTEPCVVTYSDIFYEANAVLSLMQCEARLAVTYDPHWLKLWERRFRNPLDDAETFRIERDGSLAEIGNKPRAINEIQGQYMGLLRFTPEGWSEVVRIREALTAEECDRMHMTGTLQRVVDAGRVPVMTVRYEGQWGEVDSIADLAAYED